MAKIEKTTISTTGEPVVVNTDSSGAWIGLILVLMVVLISVGAVVYINRSNDQNVLQQQQAATQQQQAATQQQQALTQQQQAETQRRQALLQAEQSVTPTLPARSPQGTTTSTGSQAGTADSNSQSDTKSDNSSPSTTNP